MPRAIHDLEREQAPLLDVVLLAGAGAVIGVLASTLLGIVYDRLPAPWFTGRGGHLRFAAVAMALAILFGMPAGSAWFVVESAMPWQSEAYLSGLLLSCRMIFVFALMFWLYVHHASRVTERFQDTRARLLESQAQSREARLGALRSQLNAHFLFNALSSAIGLVEADPRGAKDMLRDLSALLRRSLAEGGATTTSLHDELDFLLQYLRVEQARFGDELHLRVDVEDALAHVPVPAMILQPLVENAVKHGARRRGALSIELSASKEADEVTLKVTNTGTLDAARSRWQDDGTLAEASKGAGAGLRLVRERLSTCYPRTGRFDLREEEDQVVAQVAFDAREVPPAARVVA